MPVTAIYAAIIAVLVVVLAWWLVLCLVAGCGLGVLYLVEQGGHLLPPVYLYRSALM